MLWDLNLPERAAGVRPHVGCTLLEHLASADVLNGIAEAAELYSLTSFCYARSEGL